MLFVQKNLNYGKNGTTKNNMKIQFPEINLKNIKGVFLDLDDTLYNYQACHEKAIIACYKQFSTKINKDSSFEEFNDLYRKNRDIITERLYPSGACRSRLFAFKEMFEKMKLQDAWILALEYQNLYWNTIIKNMKLESDAKNFLKDCKKHGLVVCILSDMLCETQILKLQKLGISNYINYLITSEEVGFEKPNKQIFEFALKKSGLNPHEVIVVGDSEEKDIAGAKTLNIKSYKVQLVEE
jgi:putative hydrolase of the HAD superfamily